MPRNFFFDAKLVRIDTFSNALVPVLRAVVQLSVGSGGVGSPHNLAIDALAKVRVDLTAIDPLLSWKADTSGPSVEIGPAVLSRGFPASLRLNPIEVDSAAPAAEVALLFPLQPSAVSLVEELRRGEKPRFSIALRLTGFFRADPTPPQASPVLLPFVEDQLLVHPVGAAAPNLEIERSAWVEGILPGLGVGRWMVFEVPVETFAAQSQADTYLSNAVRQFSAGEYKLCMAACRDVVETLERELESNSNSAFSDKFGSSEKKMRRVVDSFRELVGAALSYEGALKSLLAAGAHPEREDEWVGRPDAELALWTALALRRYVGMRIRDARPPTVLRNGKGGADPD